jgi:chromosomal replication initiation ATPase DnaA
VRSAYAKILREPGAAERIPAARIQFAREKCAPPDERALELCEGMIDIAAALFNVSGKDLRRAGRTALDVSRVRQITMYVAHVVLRLNMADIGRGFNRDRTTVKHACHLVEDLRDDEDFDHIVLMVERVALAAFRYRLGL